MARPVVFLDACVLYPPLLREILLRLAGAGVFRPAWTLRVLAEWRIAAAREAGSAAEAEVDAAVIREVGVGIGRADPAAMRRALKRAKLPRLGKAWEAEAG